MSPLLIPLFGIVFTAIVLIYLIKSRTEAKRGVNEAEKEQMQAQIDALQERVEVLEKIVTDKNYELKRKIDEL